MKKRLAQQSFGGSSSVPPSKKSKYGAEQQPATNEHGLEFVKERKLEALQSTFKQKQIEIRTLRVEAAKEKLESNNAQASLSAFSRQWDVLNHDLSTMAERLGIDKAKAAKPVVNSILKDYFKAGVENSEAHTTNFSSKLHYIVKLLGLPDDDDDDEDDDMDGSSSSKKKKGKKKNGGKDEEEFEKIKQNAEISSRLISKQMDNVTQKKLATTRQLIENIMNTIEGKNNSKSISSNELILTLETKEKELITRLHALEDVNAKSALELKQLITKNEMEKDINQRLLWRIQRYINNGSDNSKNNTSSGSSSSSSSTTTITKTESNNNNNNNSEDQGELQNQLNQLKKEKNNELNLLKSNLDQIKKISDDRESQIETLTKSLVELKNVIRKLRSDSLGEKDELIQLRDSKNKYQNDLNKLSEELNLEKKAIANLRKDYDMKIRNFNEDLNNQATKDRDSAQKYTKYADELKIKLSEEQQKNKLLSSLEEQIQTQKQLLQGNEAAKARVEKLLTIVESKNKDEETKALYDELAEVEKAYGEQEELNGKLSEELTETKRTNLKLHSEKKKAEQKANIEKQKNDLLQHEVAVLKKKQIPLENRISDLDRSFKQSEQTNLDNQGKLAMVEKKNKELIAIHGDGDNSNNSTGGMQGEELRKENDSLTQSLRTKETENKRLLEKISILEKKNSTLKSENKSLVKQNGGGTKSAQTLATILKALHCTMDQSLPRNCVIRRCGHTFSEIKLMEAYNSRRRKCPECGIKFDMTDVIKFNAFI